MLEQAQTQGRIVPIADQSLAAHHLEAAPGRAREAAEALYAIAEANVPAHAAETSGSFLVGFLVIAVGIAPDPADDPLRRRPGGELARQVQTVAAALAIAVVQIDALHLANRPPRPTRRPGGSLDGSTP